MKICQNCKNEITRNPRLSPQRWEQQKFCSVACRVEYKRGKEFIGDPKSCKNCSKEINKDTRITLERWANQLFCCNQCRIDFKRAEPISAEEERLKKNQYMREWLKQRREKHPEIAKEINRKAHAQNKERNNLRAKEWRKEIRKEIFMHYSNGDPKCACCGEREYEFLSLDHVNNDGAVHRRMVNVKGGIDMYMWIVKNNYPDIFQILCHNCNWSKRHPSGVCVHKRKES